MRKTAGFQPCKKQNSKILERAYRSYDKPALFRPCLNEAAGEARLIWSENRRLTSERRTRVRRVRKRR